MNQNPGYKTRIRSGENLDPELKHGTEHFEVYISIFLKQH